MATDEPQHNEGEKGPPGFILVWTFVHRFSCAASHLFDASDLTKSVLHTEGDNPLSTSTQSVR
jgi:hypothetical protein